MQVKSHINIQWCLNFGIHWISFNWCFWLIGYLSLINCCITTCVTISVIFLMKFFFDMFSVAHFGPKTIHQIKVDNCVGAVKLENDAENFHLFIFSNSVLIIFAELYISLNLPTSFCCSATFYCVIFSRFTGDSLWFIGTWRFLKWNTRNILKYLLF